MAYSLSGLIFPQGEISVCTNNHWEFVTLDEGVCLLPIDRERDYLFLTEGDDTKACEKPDIAIPEWLSQFATAFTQCAYLEAEFWGGTGMQASCIWNHGQITFGPRISEDAINAALRRMGIDDDPRKTLLGICTKAGRDPFDRVGLGRFR